MNGLQKIPFNKSSYAKASIGMCMTKPKIILEFIIETALCLPEYYQKCQSAA
jgi:hypothetical protein